MLQVISSGIGMYSKVALLALAICIIALFLYEIPRKLNRVPFFPGPPGWPVIGNLFSIHSSAAQKYRKWSQYYGDVFQIQLGHIPVLVVNTAASAKAIFSGHSNALCSRPVFFTFHQVSPLPPHMHRMMY